MTSFENPSFFSQPIQYRLMKVVGYEGPNSLLFCFVLEMNPKTPAVTLISFESFPLCFRSITPDSAVGDVATGNKLSFSLSPIPFQRISLWEPLEPRPCLRDKSRVLCFLTVRFLPDAWLGSHAVDFIFPAIVYIQTCSRGVQFQLLSCARAASSGQHFLEPNRVRLLNPSIGRCLKAAA